MKAFRFSLLVASVLLLLTFSSCKKSDAGFALISPASNSTNVPTNQTFTCGTVNGALTYIFVFTNSTNAQTSMTAAIPSTTVNFLNTGETYTWYVSATMPNGSVQTSNTWSFTVSGTNSTTLALQGPANNATGICTRPTFSWSGSASASYDIVIASDPTFASLVHTATVTGTSYSMPAGILGTYSGYYWRIAPTGTSNYTGYFGFQTIDPPAMRTPQDNTTTATTAVSFSWSPSLCASSYTIQLSEYSDFHNIVTEQTFNTTSCTLTQLSSSTRYYWRVKVTGDPYYSSTLYGTFLTP